MNIRLFAPLQFTAGPDPSLPSRFNGIAYSGGIVPDRQTVIDLSSTRIAAPLPLLREHEYGANIGVVDAARNDWQSIAIEGRLFADLDPLAADVARKAARGTPWGLSIGLYSATPSTLPSGQTIRINGRDFTGPLSILAAGEIREISVVSVAADPAATVAVFSQAALLSPRAIYAARAMPQAPRRLDTAAALAFACR